MPLSISIDFARFQQPAWNDGEIDTNQGELVRRLTTRLTRGAARSECKPDEAAARAPSVQPGVTLLHR